MGLGVEESESVEAEMQVSSDHKVRTGGEGGVEGLTGSHEEDVKQIWESQRVDILIRGMNLGVKDFERAQSWVGDTVGWAKSLLNWSGGKVSQRRRGWEVGTEREVVTLMSWAKPGKQRRECWDQGGAESEGTGRAIYRLVREIQHGTISWRHDSCRTVGNKISQHIGKCGVTPQMFKWQ